MIYQSRRFIITGMRFLNLNITSADSTSSMYDNDIGIPYILMSKAPGRPLSETWKLALSNKPELAEHKKVKVLC